MHCAIFPISTVKFSNKRNHTIKISSMI